MKQKMFLESTLWCRFFELPLFLCCAIDTHSLFSSMIFVKLLFLFKRRKYPMGKGDQRSKRGKVFRGTFGKTRPKKPKKAVKTAESK